MRRYLPLSAALGGFCVAPQRGVVSRRLHLPKHNVFTDSLPLDKLLSNPQRGIENNQQGPSEYLYISECFWKKADADKVLIQAEKY